MFYTRRFHFPQAAILACVVSCAALAAEEIAFTTTRHVYERGGPCVLAISVPGGDSVRYSVVSGVEGTVPVQDGVARLLIDTNLLRSGDYLVTVSVATEESADRTAEFPLTIAKAHDAERIPVWRWGGGGSDPAWWMQRGFTGAFLGAIRDPLKDGHGKRAQDTERLLERAARHDFELGFYFHTLDAKTLTQNEGVLSLLPDGSRQSDPPKPYPLEAEVVRFTQQATDSWMKRFHDYPGLRHVMLNSEWQTPYSVNDVLVDMAQREIGLDVRDFVTGKGGLVPIGADEVKDGLIEDDNPRYRFLQWWGQRGHGTAVLDTMQHDIVKQHAPRLITWHEPYRLTPVRYSHKGLDCIGTWTYGHPDIKRLCYTTYLQAAARPEGQLVQQDITLFVYGRFAIPLDQSKADLAQDFAGGDPFFTAGPDYAREAMWIVLSQRPDILCFYSAGKLSPDKPSNDPFYTSPDTFHAIGQTCEELVQPYGPAIRRCQRVAPQVALLMSAAATWFKASSRLPGYPNEQTLPYATLLMMNHVPFDVVLDEDIVEGALDRYRVLVMPKADTLTRSMHQRIQAFAAGGGTVIADASLRAAVPNAQITRFDFTHQLRIDGRALAKGNAVTAEEDREFMEGYARELAPLLSGVPGAAQADSPRVLTNCLEGGAARYQFFVNDHRTYGPRFGPWKLRFELGAPQTATASVAIDGRPALYDALRRARVDYECLENRAVFPIRMTGARGKLIVSLPEAIGRVALDVPASAQAGQPVPVRVEVLGESGAILAAVLPLRVDIRDALGRKTEWGRYTATHGGLGHFIFVPALNDALGQWTVRATEWVSGKNAEATLWTEK